MLTNEKREWLKEQLDKGPVIVTFTKKDGTERIMPCTTNHEIIAVKGKSADYLYQASETLTVFDLEKNDWRSFQLSSVKEIELV
jgi:translation elongation factor P/translation initiation factor 5A